MDPTTSADPRTDEGLLGAARNGDEGALAALVERDRDRLERLRDVFQGVPGGIEGIWG
jgi:hypothetical protein